MENYILFQLVGFRDENEDRFKKTMNAIEKMIIERFDGNCKSFIVDKNKPEIIFEK